MHRSFASLKMTAQFYGARPNLTNVNRLRCWPLSSRLRSRLRLVSVAPRDQLVQVIPVRPIGAKTLFVEQSLRATTQTDLVRVALHAHRPAHLAMPAATE